MADKITNIEDYKKRELGTDTDTDIKIEDPYNFFNEQEREEYFKERQKELIKEREAAREQENQSLKEEKPEEKPVRNKAVPRKQPYEDEAEDIGEDDQPAGGLSMELIVRISSITTGIIILVLLGMLAKVKIFDRYFIKDPDQETTAVEQLALPAGYTEQNDNVEVTAKMLNLRSVDNSDSDATVVTSVPQGTVLRRIAVNAEGTWAIVEYNGARVYASMKYLEVKN